MPDILLSNDDLTVLGSPEIVELLVDIGPQGQRGSQIYFGLGDPNDPGVIVGQTIQLNDLYINASPGTDYSYLYQYQSQPGGSSWVKIIKMNPPLYSKLNTVNFVAGSAELEILISNIATATGTPFTANNFNVQYQIINTNPISCSMTIPPLAGDESTLVINLKAVEYDGTSWADLDGDYTIHTFISVMI
jgi:hypothetical protein